MTARTPSTQPSVAIVGMACRVPGAAGLDEFWRLLTAGRDATGDPPPGRSVTRRAGYLDDIEWFDNDWFAISAREAALMDPQQRVALEVSVEALDDAGIGYRTRASDAAVVFGACGYDHGVTVLGGGEQDAPYAVTGSALSIIANRLSYALDLHGPSLVVDSACSSSLAAVDIALRLLADETVPFAIVGGVNLTLLPHTSDYLAESGFLAEDGRCKPFSAAADGYTRSDGCGVLVLQRTADARREGNRVYAEILGAAVGSDGRSNGLYAPNGRAQRETVRAAWSRAGLDPRRAGYIECHGTGTALGDAVEVGALAAVLGGGDTWIGSVKSNLGHLEAAAGVTGLIKTALSIHRGVIAPTIHFDIPNPLLKLAERGLRVPTEPIDWTAAPEERLAGVSSFGFGGTNAHVVLRGYPESAASRGDEPPVLIPVTGRDVADLQIQALALAQRLDSEGEFASSRGDSVRDSVAGWNSESAGRTGITGLSDGAAKRSPGRESPRDTPPELDGKFPTATGAILDGEPRTATRPVLDGGSPTAAAPILDCEFTTAASPVLEGEFPTATRAVHDSTSPTAAPPVLDRESPTATRAVHDGESPTATRAIRDGESPTAVTPVLGRESPTAARPVLDGELPTANWAILDGESPTATRAVHDGESPTAAPPVFDGESPTAAPPVFDGESPTAAPPVLDRVGATADPPVPGGIASTADATVRTARPSPSGWCRSSATAIAENTTSERIPVPEPTTRAAGRDETTAAAGYSTSTLRPLAAAAARLLPEDARASVIAHDRATAVTALRALARGESGPAITGPGTVRRRGGVLFLFSGQGGQHARMGRALAARYPVFARALAEAADAIAGHGGPKVWTPRYGFGLGEDGRAATELVQPAIFAYQVASAELLASWGIRPDAVAGHSLGEIAAAAVSGALTLADAALVAVRRSRALATLDGQGAMALLEATPDETERLVAPVRAEVAIAAVNGPRSVVVSGTPRYIDTVVRRAKRRGMFAQRIAVDFAAHSPQVSSVLTEFIGALGDLAPRTPHTPVYSTTRRGAVLTTAALDRDYWAENASGTVELAAALERAAADGLATVLELAPHSVLASAAREYPEFRAATYPIADRDDEAGAFLRCLAGLYDEGRPLDWSASGPFVVPPPRRRWRRSQFDLVTRHRTGRATTPFRTGSLEDHVVRGVPTVPAVHWVRRLLHQANSAAAGMIADFVVHERTDLSVLPEAVYRTDDASVRVHAGATLLAAARPAPGPTPADIVAWMRAVDANRAAQHRMRTLAAGSFYDALRRRGLEYGPRFRPLRAVAAAPGRALGHFDAAELHSAATLDGCLHLLAAAADGTLPDGLVPLPIAMDTAWVSTEPGRVVAEAHAVTRERTARGLIGDVVGTDQHGVPVLAFSGVRVRFADARSVDHFRHDEDFGGEERGIFRTETWQPILDPASQSYDLTRVPPINTAHYAPHPRNDATPANSTNAPHYAPHPGNDAAPPNSAHAPHYAQHLANDATPANSTNAPYSAPLPTNNATPANSAKTAHSAPHPTNDATLAKAANDAHSAPHPGRDAALAKAANDAHFAPHQGKSPTQASSADIAHSSPGNEPVPASPARRGSTSGAPHPRRALVVGESDLAVRLSRALERTLPTERIAREPDAAGAILASVLLARDAADRTALVTVWPDDGGEPGTSAVGRVLDVLQCAQSDPAIGSLTVLLPQRARRGSTANAIAGLTRTLQLESGRPVRLVWTDTDPRTLPRLVELVTQDAHPAELEVTAGELAVRRFVPATPDAPPIVIDPDGTYVVTGGLGALGAVAVRWLLDAGARDVVVLTRSPRPVPAVLDGSEDHVVVVGCDVADRSDLANALNDIRECGSTIRGVIHAAGALEDAAFEDVDADQLARMFAPKVGAAADLVALTAADPTDFVLLFSSATGAFGAPGQAAYAAANAAMDAVAAAAGDRRVLSIGWGVWATGLAATAGGAEHLRRAGIAALDAERGAAMLAKALRYHRPYLLALDYTPTDDRSPVAARLRELLGAPSSFERSPNSAGVSTARGSDNPIRRSDGVAPADPESITAAIRRVLAATLDLPAEMIGATDDFNDLGLSSLLAIEARRTLEARLRIAISTAELFQHPTIAALGAALADRVAANDSEAS